MARPVGLAAAASCCARRPLTPETELTSVLLVDDLAPRRSGLTDAWVARLHHLDGALASFATALRIVRNFAEAMSGTEAIRAAIRPFVPICEFAVLLLKALYTSARLDMAIEACIRPPAVVRELFLLTNARPVAPTTSGRTFRPMRPMAPLSINAMFVTPLRVASGNLRLVLHIAQRSSVQRGGLDDPFSTLLPATATACAGSPFLPLVPLAIHFAAARIAHPTRCNLFDHRVATLLSKMRLLSHASAPASDADAALSRAW